MKQVGRDTPYQSSYVVDYEALTGLSLLRVTQEYVWPGASHAQTMPLKPHRWLCLRPSAAITGERPLRGLYSHRTWSHNIDDPRDTGSYIQQDNIRFYHTICK
jgi:hypothetical protein